QIGVLDEALRRGLFMLGVQSWTNLERGECETVAPGVLPYGFLTLPQYDTEDLLRAELRRHGGAVAQGTRLVGFTRDADGITARVADAADAERTIRCRYLVGCDGAHSTVRKVLGVDYEGDAYQITFMLGDVLVHWDRARGYGHRMTRTVDGELRN